MTLDDIEALLNLVRQHDLSEFELEQDGVRIRLRKEGRSAVATPVPPPAAAEPASVGPVPVGPPVPLPADEVELAVVTSPIVGTFYRSAEPSAPPFVDVGQRVKKGQTMCIIEAMKLMNEIDSEYEGELVKVYVENGQPVQYGERLFAIRLG